MGFWLQAGLWAGFFVLNKAIEYVEGKDQSKKGDRVDRFDVNSLPRAEAGTKAPVVFGRTRVRGVHVLWHDKPRMYPVTRSIRTGTFDTEKITIAYEHILTVQLGVCATPSLSCTRAFEAVWAGEKRFFSNRVEAAGTVDTINSYAAKSLWGGPGKGGGVGAVLFAKGQIHWYPGTFDQPENTFVRDRQIEQGLTPSGALHGFMHAVFWDFSWGESGQLPPVSFEVEISPSDPALRAPNPLRPDANPAAILYYILCDPWVGLGLPTSKVDVDSFNTVFDVLEDESFELSFVFYDGWTARDMIQEVLRHIDAVLYEDRTTGTLTLKLIRPDYVEASLPLFDESNIVGEPEYSVGSWEDTYNQVVVKYEDRFSEYQTQTAFAQDMGNFNMQGQVRTKEIEFFGCKRAELANTLAARELRTVSVPATKIRIVTDREGATLNVGGAFRWSWSDYGITEMVLRVTHIDYGDLDDNKVVIDAQRDQYADVAAPFADPPAPWEMPTPDFPTEMDPIDYGDTEEGGGSGGGGSGPGGGVFESPWWTMEYAREAQMARAVGDATITYYAPHPGAGEDYVSGEFETNNLDFRPLISFDGGITYEEDPKSYEYTDSAIVSVDYSKTEGPYDTTVGLIINRLTNLSVLKTATEEEIRRSGKNVILVGQEIMAYESYTDNGDGTYTLHNIWRGLMDTVPESHVGGDTASAGATRVLFISEVAGRTTSRIALYGNEQVMIKGVPSSGFRETDPDVAVVYATKQLDYRALRPLSPTNFQMQLDRMRLEGVVDPGNVVENELFAYWTPRPRTELLQRGDDDDIAAEAGTTFSVEVDFDGTTTEMASGVADSDEHVALSSFGFGPALVRVWSHLDGLASRVGPEIDFELLSYRQLLVNPSFTDLNGSGYGWTTFMGTPTFSLGDPSPDGRGHVHGSSTFSVHQTIDVSGFDPEGKTAQLSFLHRAITLGAGSGPAATIEALNDSDTVLGSVTTPALTSSESAWTREQLSYSNLPAGTTKLKVWVGASTIEIGEEYAIDHLDLRLFHSDSGELLANGDFEVALGAEWVADDGAGWTTTALAGHDPAVGSKMVHGPSMAAAATGEHRLVQDTSILGLPVGAVLIARWWQMYMNADDRGWVEMEILDAASNVLASISSQAAPPYTPDDVEDQWSYRELYLDVPAGADTLRIKLVSNHLSPTQTSAGVAFDDVSVKGYVQIANRYFMASAGMFSTIWPSYTAPIGAYSLQEASEPFADGVGGFDLETPAAGFDAPTPQGDTDPHGRHAVVFVGTDALQCAATWGAGDFSVWLKIRSDIPVGTTTYIFSKGGTALFFQRLVAGKYRLGMYTVADNYIWVDSYILDDGWHDVLVTRNKTTGELKILVDGTGARSATGNSALNGDVSASSLEVGDGFAGAISFLEVFGYVVGEDQWRDLIGLPAADDRSIAAGDDFDIAPAQSAYDLSSATMPLVDQYADFDLVTDGNDPNLAVAVADPVFAGNGIEFIDAADRLKVTDASAHDAWEGSITYWLRACYTAEGVVLTKADQFRLYYVAGELRLTSYLDATNTGSIAGTDLPADGVWHDIFLIFDWENLETRLVVDGGLLGTSALAGTPPGTNGAELRLGWTAGQGVAALGKVRAMRVFDRALTETEIQKILNIKPVA